MSIILGVDISKHCLDCYDSFTKKNQTFPYTPKGIKELLQLYTPLNIDKIIIEPTGSYQKPIHKILSEKGFFVSIVNPYKSRCFAKSAGFLAKTDKVDAKMLCAYGEKIDVQQTLYPSQIQQELGNLIHYKEILIEELQRQKINLSMIIRLPLSRKLLVEEYHN